MPNAFQFSDEYLDEVRRKFPAKYTPAIIDTIVLELRSRLITSGTVLDPYAGIGGIHKLREHLPGIHTIGMEIEPEFAACSEGVYVGDSAQLGKVIPRDQLDDVVAVVTSPDYGNRLADQYLGSDNEKCRVCNGRGWVPTVEFLNAHPGDWTLADVHEDQRVGCTGCEQTGKAKSKRMGYAIAMGRKSSPGSGTRHQFGTKYRSLHLGVLGAVVEAVNPGTLLVYNVSSSLDTAGYRPVMEWWLTSIARCANIQALVPIETPRLGFGANHDRRAHAEHLIIARTPLR